MSGPTRIQAPTKDNSRANTPTRQSASRATSSVDGSLAEPQRLSAPPPISSAPSHTDSSSHPRWERAFESIGNAPVQALAGSVQRWAAPAAGPEDPVAVREAAASGTRGPGGPLPYLETIQRSFGRHDVSHVRSHTSKEATSGARAMGATAFATGNHVAFASTPDLRTVAHEAAHVVQQQAGVMLKGGVGQVGDPYEQHADAVADLVVAGRSAETVLDRFAPSVEPGTAAGNAVQQNNANRVVQRNLGFEFQAYKEGEKHQGTGFKERREVEGTGKFAWQKYNDHSTYAEGNGWHVDNDGGDLEVVTDHTQVTEDVRGREKLSSIMDNIQFTLRNVPRFDTHKSKWPAGVPTIEKALKGITLKDRGNTVDGAGIRLMRTEAVNAHPQATLGMSLDKMIEMMELLTQPDPIGAPSEKQKLAKKVGWYHGTDAERLKKNVKESAEKARVVVNGEGNLALTDKLAGFLALITSYIRGTRKTDGKALGAPIYAKNNTPFMSRSDMVSVFGTLSLAERDWFRDAVSTKAKQQQLGSRLGWPKMTGYNAPKLFPLGTKEGSKRTRPETKFSIEEWLQELSAAVAPTDRLRTTEGPDPDSTDPLAPDERTFRGFASMGVDGEKVVLELRKLKGKQPLKDWKTFALNVFDLLTLINQNRKFLPPVRGIRAIP